MKCCGDWRNSALPAAGCFNWQDASFTARQVICYHSPSSGMCGTPTGGHGAGCSQLAAPQAEGARRKRRQRQRGGALAVVGASAPRLCVSASSVFLWDPYMFAACCWQEDSSQPAVGGQALGSCVLCTRCTACNDTIGSLASTAKRRGWLLRCELLMHAGGVLTHQGYLHH